MYCRLFLVLCLILNAEFCFASDDSSDWNCEEENKKGWLCGDFSGYDEAEAAKPAIDLPEPITIEKKDVPSQPPPKIAKKNTGWSCEPNAKNGLWDCSLKGSDPRGEMKTVTDDKGSSFNIFPPAFNMLQEQNFKMLQSRLKYDPWKTCRANFRGKYVPKAEKGNRDDAAMDVKADYTEVFDKEITSFFGNVEITRADQKVLSGRASYDTVSQTMDAQGHVYYTENEMSLFSDTALLNLKTDEARLRDALFVYPTGAIRGSADVVYRDNKDLSRYKNAAFTSCRPGNQDWVMHAERLKINRKSGKGAAKHAWMEFKGIPVLYTPYISFPIDDRRVSGLLTPSFGSNSKNGFDTAIPYYWNIAPNYDMTITPRYMTKRGGMIRGDFRYLTKMSQGEVGVEYLPYDLLRKDARYLGTFKNTTVFSPQWNATADINYVSDKEYFDELNDVLGMSASRFLPSTASVNYASEGISFATNVKSYQSLDNSIPDASKPYHQLPQVSLNLDHSFEGWPLDIAMENEYVNFYRDGRVGGHRLNVKPSLAVPIKTAAYHVKPKISVQHSEYFLSDQPVGTKSNIRRTLPIASVDTGMNFEREFEFSDDSSYIHTIEPRLFYLYIPKTGQDDIPIFDSSLYDYSFDSIFRENRFSGTDRIQDANQLTMAVTSRFINSKTGRDILKLSIGEVFYFRDREVGLTPAALSSIDTREWSNLIAEISGQITEHWSFETGLHWDHYENKIDRGHAGITYRNQQAGKLLNFGYRYRGSEQLGGQSTVSRFDASGRWPIYDNWYGVGRWQYSFKYNSTTDSFLGLEKESCCWRFRVIWRRYANTQLDEFGNLDEFDNKMDEGVFVQMELKGFANFGTKIDEFLERNLSGYQRIK